MGKNNKPKRIPPMDYPTNEDYARLAALRVCGGCSGRGQQEVRLPNGKKEYPVCAECNGIGTVER